MVHLAGVDLGASSGRVIRGTFDGSSLKAEEIHRFSTYTVNLHGRLYWNIYALFSDIKKGLRESAEQFGHVSSIGIDSWAVDYGLLDSDGQLIGLPRHYRDSNTVDMVNEFLNTERGNWLFDRTGIQLMPINSVFQLLAQMKDSQAIRRASDLLMIPDLINYFLTGLKRSEFTNATTTQLMNASSKKWDDEVLRRLQIPQHLFQRIVQPGSVLGTVTDVELSQVTGLKQTPVVHVASHDTASAVIAIPHKSQRYAYISSGTWSLLGTTVPAPLINATTRRLNFTNEGGYANYRFLKNIMGLWLLQQTLVTFQRAGRPVSVDKAMGWVDEAEPFAFFFNVDDERFLQPGDIPKRIRNVCEDIGQKPPTDDKILVRGILENLAFRYRVVLESMDKANGHDSDVIHIVGGGCQNAHLCQFTANVTNRPVVAGPVEATATGNLLMQLIALGELSGVDDIRDVIVKSSKTITYEPERVEVWDNAFQMFKRAVDD